MKQHHFKKSKLSQICSWEAYEWLDNWLNKEKFPNYPFKYEPKDYFYKNTKHREYLSKFIESVIIEILKHKGADPQKAPDKGRYIDKTQLVTDSIGRTRKIGGGMYVKQKGVRPGRADVQVFFKGNMWNFEVKVGKDRLSLDQLQERERALTNGERYEVIKTIDDILVLIK
ncbi:MAG: hypothetical protein OEY89_01400 [Gammaproteobacteria bacterium]|nr:hypothetical protein [Gammaproteobacteria bacterium]